MNQAKLQINLTVNIDIPTFSCMENSESWWKKKVDHTSKIDLIQVVSVKLALWHIL